MVRRVAEAGDLDEVRPWASISKMVVSLAFGVETRLGTATIRPARRPTGRDAREPACPTAADSVSKRAIPSSASGPNGSTRTTASTSPCRVDPRGATRADNWLAQRVFRPFGMTRTTLDGPTVVGVVGSTNDLARLAVAWLRPDGIAKETRDHLIAPYAPQLNGFVPGFGQFSPCPWGLGPEVQGDKHHWMGDWPSASFGHFGKSGALILLNARGADRSGRDEHRSRSRVGRRSCGRRGRVRCERWRLVRESIEPSRRSGPGRFAGVVGQLDDRPGRRAGSHRRVRSGAIPIADVGARPRTRRASRSARSGRRCGAAASVARSTDCCPRSTWCTWRDSPRRRRRAIPLIVSVDDLRPLRGETQTHLRIEPAASRRERGATLVASSRSASHEVISVLGVARNRVVVVPPAVPLVDGDARRHRPRRQHHRRRRPLHRTRAAVDRVRHSPRFARRRPREHAAGSEDPFERLAVTMRPRQDARDALANARVVMHLSDGARFPSFAIAALSAGVPTLARATEINRELLEGAAALFRQRPRGARRARRGVDQRLAPLDHGRGRSVAGRRFRAGHRGARLPLAVPRSRARLDGVKRTITISIEQLNRPQPGGIATYVRGLATRTARRRPTRRSTSSASAPRGARVDGGIAPARGQRSVRRAAPVATLADLAARRAARRPTSSTRRRWPVRSGAGARRRCTRSRCTTCCGATNRRSRRPAGIRFHDDRLKLIADREELRVLVTSPGLAERLVDEGIDASRIHYVRLGVDDDTYERRDRVERASTARRTRRAAVRSRSTRARANRARTSSGSSRRTRRPTRRYPELGALVLAGPSGWGERRDGRRDGARYGAARRAARSVPRRHRLRVRPARRRVGSAAGRGAQRRHARGRELDDPERRGQ